MTRVAVSVISTAPQLEPISASLDKNTTSALVATVSTIISKNSLLTTGANATWQNLGYQRVSVLPGSTGAPYAVVIGKFGLSPKQMENAGVLKVGSALLVEKLVNSGRAISAVMTPNMFTGKFGAYTLLNFVHNISAQTNTLVINMRQSQTMLSKAGVMTGKEDPSQIAGLVMSGATIGIPATIDFVKNSFKGTP